MRFCASKSATVKATLRLKEFAEEKLKLLVAAEGKFHLLNKKKPGPSVLLLSIGGRGPFQKFFLTPLIAKSLSLAGYQLAGYCI